MCALLIALCWQSLVTQTHLHAGSNAPASGGAIVWSVGENLTAGQTGPQDPPDNCPICHDVTQAGFYLLADAIVLAVPAVLLHWQAVPGSTAWSVRRRSHAWRSRGPPSALHT